MTHSNQSPDKVYREGYVDGQIDQQRHHSNGTGVGIIIGILLVAVLGVGAWLLLAPEQQDGPDVINVPSSETPESPDVNINVPEIEAPDVEIPDVEIPSSEKSSDGGE